MQNNGIVLFLSNLIAQDRKKISKRTKSQKTDDTKELPRTKTVDIFLNILKVRNYIRDEMNKVF